MNTEQQQSHLTSACGGDASKTALAGLVTRLRNGGQPDLADMAQSLVTALTQAVAHIDSGIRMSQSGFDSPPEPASEADYWAGLMVWELRKTLDAVADGAACEAPAGAVPSDKPESEFPSVVQPALRLPRHKFWGAGEPDCPQDLKAPNGELHTMRCKVCGDGWHKSVDVCFGPKGVA